MWASVQYCICCSRVCLFILQSDILAAAIKSVISISNQKISIWQSDWLLTISLAPHSVHFYHTCTHGRWTHEHDAPDSPLLCYCGRIGQAKFGQNDWNSWPDHHTLTHSTASYSMAFSDLTLQKLFCKVEVKNVEM